VHDERAVEAAVAEYEVEIAEGCRVGADGAAERQEEGEEEEGTQGGDLNWVQGGS